MRIEFDAYHPDEIRAIAKLLSDFADVRAKTMRVSINDDGTVKESAAPVVDHTGPKGESPSNVPAAPAAADPAPAGRKKPGPKANKTQATVVNGEPQSTGTPNGASAQPTSPPAEGAGQAPAASPKNDAAGGSTELSMNDVRGALEKVQAKHGGGDAGLTACRKFVADFGAKLTPKIDRISLLPKDKYRAFIDECGKAAA